MTLSIPNRLNVALAFLAAAFACALLYGAAHTEQLALRIAFAILFSYVNNTIFSLLHESVHGVFHDSPRVNRFFGRWLAAFFPTSYSLQRLFHLGHHSRNRSEAERFDYYTPHDNRLQKLIQWYGILTGLYWFRPPLSCVVYLCAPSFFNSEVIQSEEAKWSVQSGAAAMAADVERAPRGVVRAEILFVLIWQIAIFVLLDLDWQAWALCYGAFALNWSSLQYADHAWSPLDAKRGAWNLRVNPVVQWLFLNYHHHRVHHENPKIPWIHLSRFVDRDEPRPSFVRIYLSMWRGPRPLPERTS